MGTYNATLRVDDVKLGSLEIGELMPYMDVAEHHVSYQQMFTIYHFPLFLKAMADCPSSIQLLCDHGASVNAKDVVSQSCLSFQLMHSNFYVLRDLLS